MDQLPLFDLNASAARELTRHRNDVRTGRSGEHLVLAKLTRWGFDAHDAPQDSAYDVIVDMAGKIIRVQVKTKSEPSGSSWNYRVQRGNWRCAVHSLHNARVHGARCRTALVARIPQTRLGEQAMTAEEWSMPLGSAPVVRRHRTPWHPAVIGHPPRVQASCSRMPLRTRSRRRVSPRGPGMATPPGRLSCKIFQRVSLLLRPSALPDWPAACADPLVAAFAFAHPTSRLVTRTANARLRILCKDD